MTRRLLPAFILLFLAICSAAQTSETLPDNGKQEKKSLGQKLLTPFRWIAENWSAYDPKYSVPSFYDWAVQLQNTSSMEWMRLEDTGIDVSMQSKNNVYQSFRMLIPYCSSWMQDKVETLLKEIDADKSVQPFVNFANNFQQLSTHSLMLSIYQMVDQGENTHQLKQFDVIFTELARNRNREMMEQKLNSLSNMSTYPLIGAGLITVTLTMSILTILGDLINVL